MAVKGKQREQKEFTKQLFAGFTTVKVVAINPTKKQLNEILGKEDSEDDKEIIYSGNDDEGNDRIRLAFWLEEMNTKRLFCYSFNMTNKPRLNKGKDKCQIINSTCTTTWVPFVMDGDEITDELNDSVIPEWFTSFTNREKEVLGAKAWRKALNGEDELGELIRVWLGRLDFSDPETEVLVDTKKIFSENLKELRSLISLDENGNFSEEGYDTPFVVLLGVKTDENDSTKKYQQVWKKFLPQSFMKYINNGCKFPTEYTSKVWRKFKEEAQGAYPFDAFTKLEPIFEYNPLEDFSGSGEVKGEAVEPQTSDY